jgi:hypothetical protein
MKSPRPSSCILLLGMFLTIMTMSPTGVLAWLPSASPVSQRNRNHRSFQLCALSNGGELENVMNRRNLLGAALGLASSMSITSLLGGGPAVAVAGAEELTVYKTGKAPKVPGEKPQSKDDTKGTRKDPSFLRSIAGCKSACLTTPDGAGLAKSQSDCLSECQDICCTTYEQCTFAITPRE